MDDDNTNLTKDINANDDAQPTTPLNGPITVTPDTPPSDTPSESVATEVPAAPDTSEDISPEQISELKTEAVQYAKQYAKTGQSTRKEPSPDLANDQGPYYWWEKQASYEGNTWSISFWEYDNNKWQLQATKVELQPDGHSRMTAYSMRDDNDSSFPGFQVYKEQKDDRYHVAAVEDIVYLNRVLKSLRESAVN